jgi:hypothetical protein
VTGSENRPSTAAGPRSPIATCGEETCAGCPAGESVQCHFPLRDHLLLTLVWAPSILIGGAGVLAIGLAPLIGWAVYMALFFGLVEGRVLCSHCPHYAEPGRVLRCRANRGSLKLWAYRPGPLTQTERWVFLVGLAAVWLFPFAILVGGRQWLLLTLFVPATAGWFTVLMLRWCSRCMNFACPLNGVGAEARETWFARNPGAPSPHRAGPDLPPRR